MASSLLQYDHPFKRGDVVVVHGRAGPPKLAVVMHHSFELSGHFELDQVYVCYFEVSDNYKERRRFAVVYSYVVRLLAWSGSLRTRYPELFRSAETEVLYYMAKERDRVNRDLWALAPTPHEPRPGETVLVLWADVPPTGAKVLTGPTGEVAQKLELGYYPLEAVQLYHVKLMINDEAVWVESNMLFDFNDATYRAARYDVTASSMVNVRSLQVAHLLDALHQKNEEQGATQTLHVQTRIETNRP